jgi:hypothetical protein
MGLTKDAHVGAHFRLRHGRTDQIDVLKGRATPPARPLLRHRVRGGLT